MTERQPEITLDDILAELSPHGRELVEQAIGSAQRVKALRAELARLSNGEQPAAPHSEITSLSSA